jgi:hypothetical protein
MSPRIAPAHSNGLRNTDTEREPLHSHSIATHVSPFHQVTYESIGALWPSLG